jgi:hypothetical protein
MKRLVIRISSAFIAFLMIFTITACKKTPEVTDSATIIKSSSPGKTSISASKTTAKTTTNSKSQESVNTGSNDVNDNTSDEDISNGVSDGSGQDEFPEPEIFDLGGRIINVITDQPPRFSFLSPVNEVDRKRYEYISKVEQKYNCKFSFAIKNQAPAVFTNECTISLLAGTFNDDIFSVFPQIGMLPMVKQNLILPLDDYLDYNDTEVWGCPIITSQPVIKGKHYMITHAMSGLNFGIWYNKNIFANEGLALPPKLVSLNNWTWDSFLDIAINTTRDFNGDGFIDQWGFVHNGLTDLSSSLIFSNGSEPISENDGIFSFNMGNDVKALRALNFLQNLFYIYKVAPVANGVNLFVQGQAAMLCGQSYLNMGPGGGFGGVYRPEFAIEIFPFGPDNTDKKSQQMINLNGFAAANTMKDPEGAVKAFAEVIAVWDPKQPGYLSMESMLQSRYILSCLNDPEEQKAFVDGSPKTFNFINAIPGVSTAINGAITNIANGIAPGTAIDQIKNIVQTLCADNSIK